MGAWKNPDLDPNIADLVELTAIGAATPLGYLLTEDALAQNIEIVAGLFASLFVLLRNRVLNFVLELLDERIALVFRILFGIDRIKKALTDLAAQSTDVSLVN